MTVIQQVIFMPPAGKALQSKRVKSIQQINKQHENAVSLIQCEIAKFSFISMALCKSMIYYFLDVYSFPQSTNLRQEQSTGKIHMSVYQIK